MEPGVVGIQDRGKLPDGFPPLPPLLAQCSATPAAVNPAPRADSTGHLSARPAGAGIPALSFRKPGARGGGGVGLGENKPTNQPAPPPLAMVTEGGLASKGVPRRPPPQRAVLVRLAVSRTQLPAVVLPSCPRTWSCSPRSTEPMGPPHAPRAPAAPAARCLLPIPWAARNHSEPRYVVGSALPAGRAAA